MTIKTDKTKARKKEGKNEQHKEIMNDRSK